VAEKVESLGEIDNW